MRTTILTRTTNETDIKLSLCLDGGEVAIQTGIGFFDHMLTTFATHGGFGLNLIAKGDLQVDCHHTIEDTAIVLGQAIKGALSKDIPIERYGTFFIPMDESLAMATLDVSNRPYLVFDASFAQEKVGDYDSCMTSEFFRALALNAGITLHIKCPYGSNAHHQIEAIFKAVAHAMRLALKVKDGTVLSTKGCI